MTLLSVPQWSLRPGAGRYICDGGTRSREQEVEQHPSHTQTHKQQVLLEEGSGSLSECKAAFISNVFPLSCHRIMGKNSATSNTKRSSQISFSLMRKQYLILFLMSRCDCAVSVVLGCATSNNIILFINRLIVWFVVVWKTQYMQ